MGLSPDERRELNGKTDDDTKSAGASSHSAWRDSIAARRQHCQIMNRIMKKARDGGPFPLICRRP